MPQKPRIRIRAKESTDLMSTQVGGFPNTYQHRLQPNSPPPRASFSIQNRIKQATRGRERNKALLIASLVHLIGLFWLVYS